ncbi:hypothetical protein Sango_1608300 [Sesamum angolense]|uniref:DUF4218 domain-containing protein n=1 Tax=Sesamum angolense TaxID=2727404 RepID=A0AAE1WJE6_9LAMI|nr:hypothetical protein Sango_1608300 [Sesamum angolense]
MDWAQRMVFYASMSGHFSSYHDGVSDEGTRSDPTDVGPSSYYGSGPYDYVPGLSMLLINQPLWSSCTQSQLASMLYASRATAEHMTWHATYQMEEDFMCHPSNTEAWKHFDRTHPDFAKELLMFGWAFLTDGFAPHGQCLNVQQCHGPGIHYEGSIDVYYERPIRLWDGVLPVLWGPISIADTQSLCSTTLDVTKLHELERSVAVIMCNLKKTFLSAFFDSMEYLIVHLPYKGRVGGPVQYRWMYPFESFLHDLKKKR